MATLRPIAHFRGTPSLLAVPDIALPPTQSSQQLRRQRRKRWRDGRISLGGQGREDCEAALRARGVLPVQAEGLVTGCSGVLLAAVSAEACNELDGVDCLEQTEGVKCVLLLEAVRLPVALLESFADLDDLRGEQRGWSRDAQLDRARV